MLEHRARQIAGKGVNKFRVLAYTHINEELVKNVI